MNNEINEIWEMREQLATLKKQLDTQEIINDRLLKEAMSGKLSRINGQAIWIGVICLIMMPLGYLNFQRIGHSTAFCIATSALFFICFVTMFLSHYRLRKRDIYALIGVSIGGIVGGLIGGIIGLRIHKRTLRTAEDLLRQIEELKKSE